MNLVLIQSQGKGKPTLLSRFTDRKFDTQLAGDLDSCTREIALEVIENYRVNGIEEDESFDPVI